MRNGRIIDFKPAITRPFFLTFTPKPDDVHISLQITGNEVFFL